MSRFCVRKGKASAGVSSGASVFVSTRPSPRCARLAERPANRSGTGETARRVCSGARTEDRGLEPVTSAQRAVGRTGEGADRHHRLRRDHRRRSAPRAAHPGHRGGRLGQDPVRHRVPGPRCPRLRRARRAAGLRGGRRATWPPTWPRSASTSQQLERDGLLVIDAFRLDPSEIVETGAFDLEGLFIRLAMRRRVGRRQARRARHDRAAVQRAAQRGDHPRRARPAVPLAQGARPDRRDHR